MSFLPHFGVQPHYTYNIPVPERPESTDASEYAEGSHHSKRAVQTSCFGLPYQDHNYGAPPPPTPPPSPPPPNRVNGINGHIDIEDVSCNTTVVTSSQQNAQQEDSTGLPDSEAPVDDSITRCICDYIHDDGYMICCDRCSVWQHVDCMGVDRNNIPDIYYCERCEPRKLNKQRAVQLQTRKREILMIDTSATESENETKQFASKPKTSRKKKFEKKDNNNKLVNGKKKAKKLDRERRKSGVKKSPQLPHFDVKKSPVKGKLKTVKSPVITNEEANVLPWKNEQYADTYEEAPGNHYSSGLQEMLMTRKLNGQQQQPLNYPLPSRPPIQLRAQLCRVSQFGDNHRGLEAVENLSPVEPLIEYKGNVMLRDQYNKENRFFQSFQPHVLFYSNVDFLDLCVDASTYGNDARHVRRSCSPNAEVKHFVDGNQIYFYIYTTKSIAKGHEITIPFDFNYQECNYCVDCACGKPSCMVLRYHRGITNNSEEIPLQVLTKAAKKQKKIPKALDEPLQIDTSSSSKVEIQSPIVSPPHKRRRVASGSGKPEKSTPGTPVKTPPAVCLTSPKSPGLTSPPISGSSDHELDDEKSKKMTREERKLAAIMKAFEKMEKREERRKDALARIESEKSQESETESKPCKQDTKPRQKIARTKSVNSKQDDVPPIPLLVKGKDKKAKVKDKKNTTDKKKVKEEIVKVEEQEDTPLEIAPVCVTPQKVPVCATPIKAPVCLSPLKKEVEENLKEEIPEEKPEIEVKVESEEEPVAKVEEDSGIEDKSLVKLEEEKVEITSPVKEEINLKLAEKEPVDQESSDMSALESAPVKEKPIRATRKKRRGGSTPARRRTRVSSSVSTVTDSAEENSNSVPATPTMSTPVSTEYIPVSSSTPLGVEKAFKLPKTKKHLMNEWLNEKNSEHTSSKPLEVNTLIPEEAEADFVKCVPSPHTNSFSHMRRSSVSSSASNHTKAVDSIPGVQLDTSMGSAKKRWLRQAMFERSSSAPVDKTAVNSGNTSPVVCSSTTSPATSPPVDFVTPLKKRRLARESLSKESPYLPTPSTPTHTSEAAQDSMLMSPAHLGSVDGDSKESSGDGRGEKMETAEETSGPRTSNSDANIFEKLELSRIEEEDIKIEKPLLTNVYKYDALSLKNNISETDDDEHECKIKTEEDNDLKADCSQGPEGCSELAEKQTPHSSGIHPSVLSSDRDEPSTSQNNNLCCLNSSQSEASFSSGKLTSYGSDPDISQGDSSISDNNCKSSTQCKNQFFHDPQTEENIDSSCVLSNENKLLNVSQDSGLLSDQERTCSSSCNDSQEIMSSSFDSIHSLKNNNKVESTQTLSEASEISLTENNECEAIGEHDKVLISAEENLTSSRTITKYSATADSSKDNNAPSIVEGGLDCSSFEIGSSSKYTNNNNKCSSITELETTSSLSSSFPTVCTSEQGNNIPVVGEDSVSCSWETCTAEAEAKVCHNNMTSTQTVEVSDLEEGELPSHSNYSESIEMLNIREESDEKEEGEITDDDEEIVDSSSVVNNDEVVNSVNDHQPQHQDSNLLESNNEVDNIEDKSDSCSKETSVVDSSVPAAYRLDSTSSSSQNEVSSSRSMSPYWGNSLYRKRGWWRQEKEVTDSNERSPRSQNSSPTTANSSKSPRPHSRDLKSNEQEDQFVDSTSERERTSVRRSHNHHSPVISSSEYNTGMQRDRSISLDSTGGLSPASAADSITSPTSASHASGAPGKKKVSLLEYRKRMKQRSQDSTTGSSSSVSRSSSSSRSTPSTPLFPTLPLFPQLTTTQKVKEKKSEDNKEGSASGSQNAGKKRKDEVKWCATATMAERIREQTQLTLTERLRREFGLDTMDESEDNKDEDSDDEPPPPPPPPPATTSTVAMGSPQVRVVTATYHTHHHMLSQPTQSQQIIHTGGQIIPTQILPTSSATTVLITAPPQTHNIITGTQAVPSQIIAAAAPSIQNRITASQPPQLLTSSNQTEIVTSTTKEGIGAHMQQCVMANPTQLYPGQNMYTTMQTSGIDPMISYAATQPQPNHQFSTINHLTSVPLPLEPTAVAQQVSHHHSAPQLPIGPKPPAPDLPPPPPPTQLAVAPQPPALDLTQPPPSIHTVAPQSLLPTSGSKAPLLPTPQTVTQLPPPPLPPTPQKIAETALPTTSTTGPIPAPLLPLPQPTAAVQQSMLLTNSVAGVTNVLQQSNSVSDGTRGVPSLLSIPTMPTKVFNRSLMEENNQSGVQQGPSASTPAFPSQTQAMVDSVSTPVVVSSSASTQALFPPPPQPPVLVNYNHGYPAASAFQQ